MADDRVYVFLLLRREKEPDRIIVWDTQDISVGRSAENDVVVDDLEMSRSHASFRRDGEHYLVDNLSSSNPTFVNDEAITTHQLKNKDLVKLADTQITFYRVMQNPVALGVKRTEFASQLKGFGANVGGDGEATVLGLMDAVVTEDDEFDVRPAGDFDHDMAGMEQPPMPPKPRNLDLELAEDDVDELSLPRPSDAGQGQERVSVTLEIEGLSPEQRQQLAGLLGKVIELPALRVRVKAEDLG